MIYCSLIPAVALFFFSLSFSNRGATTEVHAFKINFSYKLKTCHLLGKESEQNLIMMKNHIPATV